MVDPCKPTVDTNGVVRADGVKLGHLVTTPEGVVLEVCDKDHQRSEQRGTRIVQVDIQALASLGTEVVKTDGTNTL